MLLAYLPKEILSNISLTSIKKLIYHMLIYEYMLIYNN